MSTTNGNFGFAEHMLEKMLHTTRRAERNSIADPRTACFHARYALEQSIKWLYKVDKSLHYPYNDNLMALIHEPSFKQNLPPQLLPKLLTIVKLGNRAAHDTKEIATAESVHVVKELWHFFVWMYTTYTPASKQVKIPPFDESLLKQGEVVDKKTVEELKKLEEEIKARDTAAEETQQDNMKLAQELARVRDELAKVKKANEKTPDDHDYSEAETRDFYIDLLLREVGWNPAGKDVREFPVVGMPYKSEQGFCDYVLWGKDGLPLAVVEAKRSSVSPEKGRQQAVLYADCLEKMHGQRPVIFYTNGYEHFIWDDAHYPPRKVQGFYSRDELQLLVNRRTDRKSLAGLQVNQEVSNRYYQIEAIKAIGETLEKRERKALVVMATGAGKTRTVIALADVLLRHNWVKRVLFLADRIALVEQAVGAFRHHLPNTTTVDLTQEKEDLNSRIMVSTYPSMMNMIDETKGNTRRFGVGHFDLVIIDEAHRSVYQKYGAIFQYFDSLLVGLTATPRDESERDTYRLFELQPGVPTYFYELEQAVKDGYLVPAIARKLELGLPRMGLKYSDLSDDEKEEYEAKFYDEETDSIPPEINGEAFNRWLFNNDTVDAVLRDLMMNGIKVEGGDKVGKTIIFARNHKHAEFIYKRFNIHYPRYKGHFARVIDNYEQNAKSLRTDFKKPDRFPQIAISVDMLDTGVDIPEVVNLVFFKPVFSKVKFLQMLGRGTRLCRDLFGPGQDKTHFLVIDVCGNFDYFDENPEGQVGASDESLSEKLFKRRLQLAEAIRERDGKVPDDGSLGVRKDLLDRLHQEVGSMNRDNFIVRPKLRYVEKYSVRSVWDGLSANDVADVVKHVAGLPNQLDPEDEDAKRFDLLMLNLALSRITYEGAFDKLQSKVQKIAADLEEKRNIPIVAEQIELIQAVQSDEYWEGITVPMIENIRRRLRNLVKFLERNGREIVYSDFDDGILSSREDRNPMGIEVTLPEYKAKVERFIREQESTLVIQKIKRNVPITSLEISQLEEMIFGSPVVEGREKFEEAFGATDRIGVFVRRLIGLDRNAAKEAFTPLIQKHNLDTRQIRFVDSIIDYLTQNGVMEVEALYEKPFTDLSDSGLDGVFQGRDADEIVGIVKRVEMSAAGAA